MPPTKRAWSERFKPRASARIHLLLAALMWTGVGGTLATFGTMWMVRGQRSTALWFLALAIVVGGCKAHFALGPAAERIARRIQARGDGRCLGGFLSPTTWLLVVAMAGGGRLLRGSPLSRSVVGWIYVVVGTALLVGARRLWQAWARAV